MATTTASVPAAATTTVEANGVVMQKQQTGSGAQILLHPLVVINISDHSTRARFAKEKQRVMGVLMGVQTGRLVEIFGSFEVKPTVVDGKEMLDLEFMAQKQEQMKKVFPTHDVLGWYSVGKEPVAHDIQVHKQLFPFNESPLFLQVDTEINKAVRDLPIKVYETEIHIANDVASVMFARGEYKIETGEAERLAVDHVARFSDAGATSDSNVTGHLMSYHGALKMLSVRIKVLQKYVEGSARGELPKNNAVLRQIASLCNQLPAIDAPSFQEDYMAEYNDTLLVTYLASITKGVNNINELVDKYNLAYERIGMRRGGGGSRY